MGIIHFIKYKWLQPKATKRTLAASTSATPSSSCSSCKLQDPSTNSGLSSDNTTPSGDGGEAWHSSQLSSIHGTDSSVQRSAVRLSTDKSLQERCQSSTRHSTTIEKTRVSTSTEKQEGHYTHFTRDSN